MLNFRKSFLSRLRAALSYSIVAIGTVYSYSASASCAWSGASSNYSVNTPIIFEAAGYKMLANNNWYEDSRYPVNSLMGVSSLTLQARNCAGLVELKGEQVNVVYAPPVNAVSSGTGYRIPTSAPGVAIDIEFPSGVRRGSEIFLGTSEGTVSSGGIMTVNGSQIPPVPVRLSIVKTGAFTKQPDSTIRVEGGLGTFRYYSSSTPGVVSMSSDQLQMPTKYHTATAGDYMGHAMAPSCQVARLGTTSLVTGSKNISLTQVNTSDFSGIGPIEKAAKSQQFSFTCTGTQDTKPIVTFSANYPFNLGLEGVGMPAEGSDIGIQVLFNDNPVKFNSNSPVLGWNRAPLDGAVKDVFYGVLGPQGFYCKTSCGSDMSGANWVSGEAGSGNNDGFNASVTFKYYQTTTKIPAARKFSVPFTITLDVQ